jgi:hypothetical protein
MLFTSCHCEERSDEAISAKIVNLPWIPVVRSPGKTSLPLVRANEQIQT